MVEQGARVPALAGRGGVPATSRDAGHDAAGDVQRLSVQFGDAGHDVSHSDSHGVADRARVAPVSCPTSSDAIRSAIMMVGMWVLADGMSGMMDASATVRPPVPWTLPAASTTAPAAGSEPMAQVPAGWW